ncbi:MAG: malectin domain-containing carbohydrate-binding protein, partial [Bacteroidota bacterium]|nr:malectin domain-containing carbohydrate-binding protein [Bacteroidota bacterium]
TFTLINADTDQPIQTLNNGSTLDLATLPTKNLNIRANSNSSSGSVLFNLSGAETRNFTDNAMPYALYGDNNGNYNAWTPKVGSYTLKGTPFTAIDGSGTAGTPLTIGLIVTTSATAPSSNALLFVENLDKFPSNDVFVASRIQVPWSRDKIVYNTNHDTLRVRIHNKGMNPLVVSNIDLSNKINWKIISLKGTAFDPSMALPLSIAPGTFADMKVTFIPPDSAIRVRFILDEISIVSNDDKQPNKTLYLRGLFQREGEGSKEPRAQEMINIFGFKSKTGFTSTDPDKGSPRKPKGDEVISSYYVRVDPSKPVTARQMGAYHGCCNQSETLRWYPKGSTGSLTGVVYHVPEDAQRLLTRRNRNAVYAPSEGSFNPTVPFGFKVGGSDWTDTLLTPNRLIGIRVWKAIDASGYVIPNEYIIANDYLGSEFTNYDYNDNMYYVTNIRPEFGPASTSSLTSTPSAVDFSEKLLSSTNTFNLNIKSLGQVYANGSQDPAINISSVSVAGENSSEFTASMPAKTTLSPQETTNLTIGFNPMSEGLKIADLLIYYNNAGSPLRVPLYGIAKASTTTVTVPYRINSGSSSDVTVNGKTWVSDVPYAFDNLEPYTNSLLTQISATDEDVIYLREQSSNGDKRPFRYEMPISNGNYVVRLHFAEIYWGAPGAGLTGGAGSRVM